jgi:hypothetical protein
MQQWTSLFVHPLKACLPACLHHAGTDTPPATKDNTSCSIACNYIDPTALACIQ